MQNLTKSDSQATEADGRVPVAAKPMRFQWIPLLGVLIGVTMLAMLVIRNIGAQQTSQTTNALPATIGPLVKRQIPELGLSLDTPSSWNPPVLKNNNSFVLSPTGSTDTSSGAGPFMYGVVDAVNVFKGEINFDATQTDPVAQLNGIIGAINRDTARFTEAVSVKYTPYPGAETRGYERGNTYIIVLMRAADGRWFYFGIQARDADMPWYENTVFLPAINSLTLTLKK